MNILEQLSQPICAPHAGQKKAAEDRQKSLTKPPGSLGKLEEIATDFAAYQDRDVPALDRIVIAIFAADHGIAAQGVSAFPQVVTGEMLKNFDAGGAAINVLAREHRAQLRVINMGTINPLDQLGQVEDYSIAAGTRDFSVEPAMTTEQAYEALSCGARLAEAFEKPDLLIGGEMGIGNTTSAAALLCHLMHCPADRICGRGTGIDDERLALKIELVERGLALHRPVMSSAFDGLRCMGGFEIAALVGAYLRSAQLGTPSLVDGFITTSAAAIAIGINPSIRPWLIFAHRSDEQAHRQALEYLQVEPLIDLSLRLGEASGAALCIPLIRSALALHNDMATFQEAGVSDG